MKQIDYTLTEAILEPYGITVEALANTNGYQTQIIDPDDENNPEAATIPNPQTALEFIAVLIPKVGVEKIIANAMASKIRAKEQELAALKAQPAIIAEQIITAITKTVTE